jgi:hypothetical protein
MSDCHYSYSPLKAMSGIGHGLASFSPPFEKPVAFTAWRAYFFALPMT